LKYEKCDNIERFLPYSNVFKMLEETFAATKFTTKIHSRMDKMALRNSLAGSWAG